MMNMDYREYQGGARVARRKQRRRRQRSVVLLLTVIVIAAAALYLLKNHEPTAPVPALEDIELPDYITVDLLTVNPYSRPGDKLDAVNGVVVHYVGNPGTTAENNRNYFQNLSITHETSASSNFVIGIDGKIIMCVPLDEVAYCSNDRNHDTLSIECCHPDDTGEFTKETMESLVKLVSWLCSTYRLDRDDVIRHYDVSGKICPKYYVENPDAWEAFLDEVFAS